MKTVFDTILSIFRYKKPEPTVFFGYSAREKKRIIVSAAREAAKMQQETVRQYHRTYGK